MSAATKIEWTDKTWNPVRGCELVSPGCTNCYAMKLAHRFAGAGKPYEGLTKLGARGPLWTGEARTIPEALAEPLRWRRPQRVFVNSMSDLFHEDVPDAFIAAVFGVMAACPQHTFQVLTKRPERMARWFEYAAKRGEQGKALFDEDPLDWRIRQWCHVEARRAGADLNADRHQNHGGPWPLPNVWLGVSVEDQRRADERIPHLLRVPAAVRFLSCEPLLEEIDLNDLSDGHECEECGDTIRYSALNGTATCSCCIEGAEPVAWGRLHWVIVGGESGPGARPFDLAWARSLVAQCRDVEVACFVKQLGARPVTSTPEHPDDAPHVVDHDGTVGLFDLASKKGGDMAEWPADLRVRQFPEVRHGG